jgi:hypothetical protein
VAYEISIDGFLVAHSAARRNAAALSISRGGRATSSVRLVR